MELNCFQNTRLVEGDNAEMLPKKLEDNSEMKVGIPRLNIDRYGHTKSVSETMYDREVSDRLLVLDHCGVARETRAADELNEKSSPRLCNLLHYSIPVFVKTVLS